MVLRRINCGCVALAETGSMEERMTNHFEDVKTRFAVLFFHLEQYPILTIITLLQFIVLLRASWLIPTCCIKCSIGQITCLTVVFLLKNFAPNSCVNMRFCRDIVCKSFCFQLSSWETTLGSAVVVVDRLNPGNNIIFKTKQRRALTGNVIARYHFDNDLPFGRMTDIPN